MNKSSQDYATSLYLYKKFVDDIFITFPLIAWSDVVKMLSQQYLQVPSRRPFCFNLMAPKTKTSKVLWLLICTSNLETITLNDIAVIGQYLWKIGCGGHLVFQKLLKINNSQAYATLYPYEKFGDDTHNFSFNWSDIVKMLSQQNLQVPSRRPFCFNLIAPKTKTRKVSWLLTCTSNLETIAWTALL